MYPSVLPTCGTFAEQQMTSLRRRGLDVEVTSVDRAQQENAGLAGLGAKGPCRHGCDHAKFVGNVDVCNLVRCARLSQRGREVFKIHIESRKLHKIALEDWRYRSTASLCFSNRAMNRSR